MTEFCDHLLCPWYQHLPLEPGLVQAERKVERTRCTNYPKELLPPPTGWQIEEYIESTKTLLMKLHPCHHGHSEDEQLMEVERWVSLEVG